MLLLPLKNGPNAYLVFIRSVDTTVNVRVYASIIVSLSKVSSPLKLFSGGTLEDLGKGYLEPPSKIKFGIGVFIRRSIIDLTSDL